MSVAKPSSVNRYIQMPVETCAAPLIALPFSAILVGLRIVREIPKRS